MSLAPRAHSSCAVCRERRAPCIYRFFGPCKFDQEEADCPEAAEGEKTEVKDKEITQRHIGSPQPVLDDQMLAADVENDLIEKLERILDKNL